MGFIARVASLEHCGSFTYLTPMPDIAPVISESQSDNKVCVVAFLRQQLLGAHVESFGIYHQFLGFDFRNANVNISRSINSKLLLEP